jgi:hypothetical protein
MSSFAPVEILGICAFILMLIYVGIYALIDHYYGGKH